MVTWHPTAMMTCTHFPPCKQTNIIIGLQNIIRSVCFTNVQHFRYITQPRHHPTASAKMCTKNPHIHYIPFVTFASSPLPTPPFTIHAECLAWVHQRRFRRPTMASPRFWNETNCCWAVDSSCLPCCCQNLPTLPLARLQSLPRFRLFLQLTLPFRMSMVLNLPPYLTTVLTSLEE